MTSFYCKFFFAFGCRKTFQEVLWIIHCAKAFWILLADYTGNYLEIFRNSIWSLGGPHHTYSLTFTAIFIAITISDKIRKLGWRAAWVNRMLAFETMRLWYPEPMAEKKSSHSDMCWGGRDRWITGARWPVFLDCDELQACERPWLKTQGGKCPSKNSQACLLTTIFTYTKVFTHPCKNLHSHKHNSNTQMY